MSFLDLVYDPPGWTSKIDEKTIRDFLHDPVALDNLGSLLVQKVQGRTHILSGSLVADETYEKDTDNSSDLLVMIYADTTEQISYWGREYDVYQEGGVMGLPTYTNPPRLMFASAETEDIGDVEAWGDAQMQAAVNWIGKP